MSRYRFVLSDPALADLDEMQAYISDRSREAGERFIPSVVETLREVAEQPFPQRLLEGPGLRGRNLRRIYVHGFPNHLLVYEIAGDTVHVLRAFHAAQDWVRHLD